MKKLFKRILLFILLAAALFFIYLMLSVPNIDNYTYRQTTSTEVITTDGVVIGEISSKNTTYVTREEIPDMLVNAVVAIEDRRFYTNIGIDFRSILRALWKNITSGEIVEGGSTITQQLAKLLFFSDEQSYIRKAKEAVTAIKLTNKFSKDDIITMYLNEIYLGGGAFGVAEAAETYFSKSLDELTLSECAMLAGIIQAPSAYCPLTEEGYGYAVQRRDKVLDAMQEEGYITPEEAQAAKEETLVINPSDDNYFSYGVCLSGYEGYMNRVFEQSVESIAAYYHEKLNYSKDKAYEMAESALLSQNLTIKATMNYAVQQNALSSLEAAGALGENGKESAFISVDILNGNVLAYYGSATYVDTVQNPRQPGSTIKPLFLSYFIENGIYDRNSIVNDEKVDINGYSPNNYANKYMGYVTMRETIANSLNSASLKFFIQANVTDVVNFVKDRFRFTTIVEEDYNAAFALGGLYQGLKPVELAMAYASIGNEGQLYEPRYIISVSDSEGKIIFAPENAGIKALSSECAGQLKSCMESAVIRGTATAADSGYATYGKTGTTDDEKDAWFAGATGNVASVIWMGSIEYESVSGLSSAQCAAVYGSFISSCAKDGCLDSTYLENARNEELTDIYVLKDAKKSYSVITESDIVKISVPTYETQNFAAAQVIYVDIDSSTGMLFVEGKCPEKNRETRLYTINEAPGAKCNKKHAADDFIEWLDNIF